MEVPGQGTLPLSNQWDKWVGPSSFEIPSGTTVIAHATNDAGQSAQTRPFAFLVDHAPATDQCTTTPPACGDWNPAWAQESGANTWWIEYAVSAAGESVATVALEANGKSTSDDPYALKADAVLSTMTVDDVRALIDTAKAEKGWRILLFHDFTSASSSSDPYVYLASDFSPVLDAIAASGLEVVTVAEGLSRIRCQ